MMKKNTKTDSSKNKSGIGMGCLPWSLFGISASVLAGIYIRGCEPSNDFSVVMYKGKLDSSYVTYGLGNPSDGWGAGDPTTTRKFVLNSDSHLEYRLFDVDNDGIVDRTKPAWLLPSGKGQELWNHYAREISKKIGQEFYIKTNE